MEKLPLNTRELIKELDKAIPQRVPSLDESDREIWFYAGKRAVVDQLISFAHNERVATNIDQIQEEVSNVLNT